MKTGREIKIVSVSLPQKLLDKADKRAREQYLGRSEYIRKLLFSDINLASLANEPKKGPQND